MAKLIDPVEVDEKFDALDSVPEEESAEQSAEKPKEGVAELPQQYRNKSIDELVKMHQEAESRLGSQGNELGELRRVVDDFILKQSQNKAPEPVEEIDFFADPDKAVESKIANHPAIKEAQAASLQYKQNQAKETILGKHPDAAKLIQDSNFINWVSNSEIRKELFLRADKNYDFAAADELFSQYKAIQAVKSDVSQAEKDSRKDAINKASTGSVKASSEKSSRKIYRRQDIIELMKTDKSRYLAMEPEIIKAYRENRVR